MKDAMQRRDIEFPADGVTLRGWFYPAVGAAGPAPTIVMAHGFSAVKEQYLDGFAEMFAAAGLNALVYDHRNLGASDGEPRQEMDPWAQVRDYRTAITYATTLPETDRERIGIWGTSYSGGHVLVVAAIDRRVKCVVAQVPHISGAESGRRRVRPDQLPALLARFDADREARFRGEPPGLFPVVAADPAQPSALPGQDCWEFFEGSRGRAPGWRNEVTLRTLEMAREYEPGIYVPRISPTPLLLIVAPQDRLTPPDLMLEAYERALHPKKLVLLPGGHFDPYIAGLATAGGAARDWFVEHLKG